MFPRSVLHCSGLEITLHVGQFHITDASSDLIELSSDTFVAFCSNTGWPFDRLVCTHILFPLRADGFQMFREVVGGSGTIGTVNHVDCLLGTTEFAVVLSLSEKDAC